MADTETQAKNRLTRHVKHIQKIDENLRKLEKQMKDINNKIDKYFIKMLYDNTSNDEQIYSKLSNLQNSLNMTNIKYNKLKTKREYYTFDYLFEYADYQDNFCSYTPQKNKNII